MKYSVIIVAAGKGTRTNLEYNKVFYEIQGESIIHKTVSLFANDEDCDEIIIVVSKTEIEQFEKLLHSDKIVYVFGGETRQESVFHGLQGVHNPYVMIHDGARPFLKRNQIEVLKQTLQEEDACFLAVPAVDTIKIVENGYVKVTPNRSSCYLAQTPQCFKTELILACHTKAATLKFLGSDDVQLVEQFSTKRIKVVLGDYGNKKITTKEDL